MTVALALMGALLLAPEAHADEDEAEVCVRAKVRESWAEGWSVRTGAKHTLAQGEHHVYAVALQAGNTYQVVACGDAEVRDLDLVIYDSDAKALVDDTTDDRQPVITFSPPATGTYYVVVYLGQVATAGARGGVASIVTFK